MAFVKQSAYVSDIYYRYEISDIYDKKTAMQWFAKTVREKISSIIEIEVDDLNTFHDGTETLSMASIGNTDDFITNYFNTVRQLRQSQNMGLPIVQTLHLSWFQNP